MKLAYPSFSDVILLDGIKVPTIVIENRPMFRTLICELSSAIDGNNSDIILSVDEKILDISKNAELITDFINFDINKKTLINKVIAELEKSAVSAEHYVKTQELLMDINRAVDEWGFDFSCDIVLSKISVSTLLKSVGVEIKNEYDGHIGEVEKIVDYMELVREFDRNKLFVTVNMRTYFDDELMEKFINTVISHEFNVLMLESQSYSILSNEKRITIDAELCEF